MSTKDLRRQLKEALAENAMLKCDIDRYMHIMHAVASGEHVRRRWDEDKKLHDRFTRRHKRKRR